MSAAFLLLLPVTSLANTPDFRISYTLGQGAFDVLDGLGGSERLRPGFHNDVHQSSSVQLSFQSRKLHSFTDAASGTLILETQGLFSQYVNDAGFGYDVNLGLGLVTPYGASSRTQEFQLHDRPSFLVGDVSAGPTYRSNSLHTGFRLGVRQSNWRPSQEQEGLQHHSAVRDPSRSGGYLSLDGRLSLSNRSELSLSVFLDDPDLFSQRDWRSEGFSNDGSGSSRLGFEMGLNF